MTQEEIIRMAREAGLHKMIQVKHVVDKVYEIPSENLERFAALVAAHEREKQAEQEPVAVISESAIGLVKLHANGVSLPFGTPLYADPVRTKDLSDNENGEWERLHGYID